MALSTTTCSPFYLPDFAHDYDQSRWYAAHTRANHEKRLAEQLAERSVEHFLPLYECVRRWKDRRVTLQLPLFPGNIRAGCPCGNRCTYPRFPAAPTRLATKR